MMMNTENIKNKIYKLEKDATRLVAEVSSSSGTFSDDDIQEMEGMINAIRSNVEYLKASVRRKREMVLHG